jgi:integrase
MVTMWSPNSTGIDLQKTDGHIKISKSTVDAAKPSANRYILWDITIPGFGLRVASSGLKTFVLRYRSRHKFAQKRFVLLGRFGPVTAEEARRRATEILGQVASGGDPAFERQKANQAALTFGDACDRFLRQHVSSKRKPGTHDLYGHIIEKKLKPQLGIRNILKVSRQDVAQLHHSMKETPVIANRAIAVMATMYSWCGRVGLISESINPAKGIEKFRETPKERYLSRVEMSRLGKALIEAETTGFEYAYDANKPNSKHGAKPGERRVAQSPQAVAAIRLLILTGCRVGEILNLRWAEVDFDRGMLHLADSKSGKKTVLIGRPALEVIETLPRDGEFVISGKDPEKRRMDLKRPWEAIKRSAALPDVRLHDLRHSFASVGAGAGLGLHIVGKLLGHSQSRTTVRYAHLADDPLKRAAEMVSNQIADALSGSKQK